MSDVELLDDDVEEGQGDEGEIHELRWTLHALDALRNQEALTRKEFLEQIKFWWDSYDRMWYKHDSEFIFDHLVRDMTKLGVNYQLTFCNDTTDFFNIIVKDSGEQGGATLNKVWSERRTDPLVSVVHQARTQAYGWISQRQQLPGRHTLSSLVLNYFNAQHQFIKALHWNVLILNSLKQCWPQDHRVPDIDALLNEIYAIDYSLRNKTRLHQLSEITRKLQTL